jgi:hypothetical protein
MRQLIFNRRTLRKKSFLSLRLSLCFILCLHLIPIPTMDAQKLNGSYRLVGVQDLASGFRFSPDGKFEYFYIYGVADRNATGTYTMSGDTIKLKSDKEAGNDFPIESQSKKGKGYNVQIKAPNPFLLQNVTALYFVGQEQRVAESNKDGVIHLDEDHVDKIYLRHEIFPDVACLIKDDNNTNNNFVVSLSPTLQQVSFKGIDLIKKGDTLTCLPNYFLPFENIKFIKE